MLCALLSPRRRRACGVRQTEVRGQLRCVYRQRRMVRLEFRKLSVVSCGQESVYARKGSTYHSVVRSGGDAAAVRSRMFV